jgi:SAM-dependent methyltransferase
MLSDILRWGGKRPGQPAHSGDSPAARGGDALVPSKALPKFLAAIAHQSETPVLIDLGPVIGSNVSFFGEQLGCKLFIEDLFADYDRHVKAGTLDEMAAAMEKRFRHEDGTVDGILCWDVFDYLPKAAAQALARQIVRMLRPGGSVMGFFCSTAAPVKAPFTKYEIADEKSLRHRPHAGIGGAKHVLLNRDIIKMFDGLIVADSFLLKSNTREILLKRRS